MFHKLRIKFHRMSGDNAQTEEAATTTASLACSADDSRNEITMTKPGLACPDDKCSKKLKNKQTLGRHMEKFHAVGQQVSNTVRNFLLSPIPGPSSAPDFPPAPSAPLLVPLREPLLLSRNQDSCLAQEPNSSCRIKKKSLRLTICLMKSTV